VWLGVFKRGSAELEARYQLGELLRAGGQLVRGSGGLLGGRCALLRGLIDLRHRHVAVLDASCLLATGLRDLIDGLSGFGDRAEDLDQARLDVG
jgi:hypothetical protein